MEYDPSKIKIEKRIINGQEVEVKVAPEGMNGRGFYEGMWDHLKKDDRDSEYQEDKTDEELDKEPSGDFAKLQDIVNPEDFQSYQENLIND